MTILDLFNSLAQRAGLTADAAGLREILSYTELAQKNVPADVATALDGLMGLEAAKNNVGLKAHFRQALYSSVDSKLNDALEAAGDLLTTAQLEELAAEKSTPARVEKALKLLQEAKPKAGDAAAREQNRLLNEQLVQAKKDHAEALKAEAGKLTDYQRNQQMEAALSGIKWAEHFPEDLRGSLAKQALSAELDKVGAVAVLTTEGRLVLKQKASPDLDFFLDNKPVALPELVQRVAAERKFIATTPPGTPPGTPPANPPVSAPASGGQGATPPTMPRTVGSAFDFARANQAQQA